MKTYIINENNQPGGNSYKEYTWKEVLEWFGAPETIIDEDELIDWYQKENDTEFNYTIEQWRNENGEIIAK